MDNAAIHKGEDVDAVERKYQVRLAYLPAYSPYLSPIEKAWSVLKRKVRHLVGQHKKTMEQALKAVLNNVVNFI